MQQNRTKEPRRCKCRTVGPDIERRGCTSALEARRPPPVVLRAELSVRSDDGDLRRQQYRHCGDGEEEAEKILERAVEV